MSVQSRDLFAPSAIEKPAGDLGMDISGSARPDTSGRNSGLGYSESGQTDLRCYAETKNAISGTVIDGGSPGIALPTPDDCGDCSDGFTSDTQGRF